MIESLYASNNYQAAKTMLDTVALRHQALAGNLANIETPGYQRLDIDPTFKTTFEALLTRGEIQDLKSLQPAIVEEKGLAAVRPDGNNVALDRELMQIDENAFKYEMLTQFVSGSLQQLKMAISGRT